MDNQVQATDLSQTEFLLVNTSSVDLLPNLSIAGLSSSIDRGLILPEVDQGSRQSRPVGNAREQDLGGIVQSILETLLADLKNVRNIGHGQEFLHVVESIGLGISVGQLCVDLGFTSRLPCHLQVSDEIVVLASPVGNFDDLGVVGGVISLDVGVCESDKMVLVTATSTQSNLPYRSHP